MTHALGEGGQCFERIDRERPEVKLWLTPFYTLYPFQKKVDDKFCSLHTFLTFCLESRKIEVIFLLLIL
jgi:hypothetical protein